MNLFGKKKEAEQPYGIPGRKRYLSPEYEIDPEKIYAKSLTVPDQSMTIEEILKRFTRNIPVDVNQPEKVYIDQSDRDLEAIGRMDAVDQQFLASEMAVQNRAIETELRKDEQERHERRRTRQREGEEREATGREQSGIDPLDNTMPDDTSLNPRPLPNTGQGMKGGSKNKN